MYVPTTSVHVKIAMLQLILYMANIENGNLYALKRVFMRMLEEYSTACMTCAHVVCAYDFVLQGVHSNFSDPEVPRIPTNSMLQKFRQVFFEGCNNSDSQRRTIIVIKELIEQREKQNA